MAQQAVKIFCGSGRMISAGLISSSLMMAGCRGVNGGAGRSSRFYVTSSRALDLAQVFNSKPKRSGLTLGSGVGLFGVPQLQNPEGFHLLMEAMVDEVSRLVAECCSPERKRKMVEVFDELSNSLCRVADLAEFVRIAHPDANFRRAAEEACVAVSTIVEQLNTHTKLYEALKSAVEDGDVVSTCAMDDHVARLFLFDFEQSGIHLAEAQRKKVVHLNEHIMHLGQRFSQAAHQPRHVHKQDLPQHLRHHFAIDGENITINGLYTDAASETAREAAYKIYLFPCSDQEETLVNLLAARRSLAQLCGFPSYAHRALQGSLAADPETVLELLDGLADQLRSRAAADYDTMRDMKKRQNRHSQELSLWDTPYLTGVARRQLTGSCRDDLSPYFSLGSCMQGLNMVFDALYGIQLRPCGAVPSGEVWNSDVYKLDVVDCRQGVIGNIYLDLYDRPGKPHQDCHFTIVGGKHMPDGSYQNPVVVLMLTLPSPSWGTPSLLTPSMADNLFHEMGHAMHSMLARTRYQHVTGTRCATDLAEVPSILMELFASEPRVVRRFARHYKTGEELPERQLHALCAAKQTFAAAEMQQQVFYSALDQRLHLLHFGHKVPMTTSQVLDQVQHQYYGLPTVPNTAWQHRFSHLVGYGAKYYSYLVSRAVATWIWQQELQHEPLSRQSGDKLRSGFLEHGGGVPARHMVASFLGKEVTAEALTQSLIVDLDMRQEMIRRL